MDKIINFFLSFILVISFPVISEAAQIDFAWSTHEFLSYRKDSEDEKKYLIWCYSIKNLVISGYLKNTVSQKTVRIETIPISLSSN